jgi:hypothetical protein
MSLIKATTTRTLVKASIRLAGEQQGSAVYVRATPTHRVRISFAGFRPVTELFTALVYEFQGGGIPVQDGHEILANDFPFNCRILSWRLTASEDTEAVVKLSRSDFDDYPAFTPIGTPLALANVSKSEGGGFPLEREFAPGDMLKAQVLSNSQAQSLTLTVRVVRLSNNG